MISENKVKQIALGSLLTYTRKVVNLSPKDVAAKMRISNMRLKEWEDGNKTPSFFALVALEKMYKLPEGEIARALSAIESSAEQLVQKGFPRYCPISESWWEFLYNVNGEDMIRSCLYDAVFEPKEEEDETEDMEAVVYI